MRLFKNFFNKYSSLPHGGPENNGRKRRDIGFARYDRDDPCIGMKQIITGFSKWSERYISSCFGQKNNSHQAKRMKKWRAVFAKGNHRKFTKHTMLRQCYMLIISVAKSTLI